MKRFCLFLLLSVACAAGEVRPRAFFPYDPAAAHAEDAALFANINVADEYHGIVRVVTPEVQVTGNGNRTAPGYLTAGELSAGLHCGSAPDEGSIQAAAQGTHLNIEFRRGGLYVCMIDSGGNLVPVHIPVSGAPFIRLNGQPVSGAPSSSTQLAPFFDQETGEDFYSLKMNGQGLLTGWTQIGSTGTGAVVRASGNVATATALAANGSNCSAAQYAQGVDASGNAEGCADPIASFGTSGSGSLARVTSPALVTPTIGGGDAITKMFKVSASISGTVPAQDCLDQDTTVTGVVAGENLNLTVSATSVAIGTYTWVYSAGTDFIRIHACNVSASNASIGLTLSGWVIR